VESLLGAHDRAGAFIEDAAAVDLGGAGGDPLLGRRIGAYRVLDQLGAGGMGTVYRAVRDDDAFRKEVALKLVLAIRRAPAPQLILVFDGLTQGPGRHPRGADEQATCRSSPIADDPSADPPCVETCER
jgi:hypothetical protein